MSKVFTILPNLLTSYQEKIDNNYENIKNFIDYYIDNAIFKDYGVERRLANNEVIESDYNKILKQYTNQNLKNFRGDIRSMPLIRPIIRLLAGEKRKSPFNYYCKVTNSDAASKYLDGLTQQLIQRNQQAFVNGLNERGVNTQVPSKEVPETEQVVQSYKRSYKDGRAIAGEELLEYAKDVLDVQETLFQAYKKNWLVTGSAYVFPDIYNDEVEFTVEYPENVYVEYSDKSPYASDGQVVVRRMRWTLSDVISRFNTELKDKFVNGENAFKWLTELLNNRRQYDSMPKYVKVLDNENLSVEEYYNKFGSNFSKCLASGTLELYYVAFKALKKYFILSYINEVGQIMQKEVSDDYVLNANHKLTKQQWDGLPETIRMQFIESNLGKDLFIEEIYTNEVWHGYKIPGDSIFSSGDKSDKNSLYLQLEPHKVQRNHLNNTAKCKLPVIGRNDGISIADELKEFQYKYNLIYLMEERTLAKDKGNPILFPIDLLPNIPQWGNTPGERLEHMLYYSDIFNVIFFDGSNDRVNALAQTLKSVNMSTIDAIAQFISLKEQIKSDAWDAIGMNRNRWGDTYASEGKSKNEQDIFRSSLHTADLNLTFNKIEEELLATFLDYSKVAYVKGKVITKYPKVDSYILSDESRAIYELDVEQHIESSYAVTVQPSDEEAEKLTAIQTMLTPYAQNGIAPEAVIGALSTKNPHKAMDYLKKAEEIKRQTEQQGAKQEQETQKQIAQMQQQTMQMQMDFQRELEFAKLQNDRLIAELQEETKRIGLGTENVADGKVDDVRLKERGLDIQQQKVTNDLNLKNKELSLKKDLENKKIEVSKRKANNSK